MGYFFSNFLTTLILILFLKEKTYSIKIKFKLIQNIYTIEKFNKFRFIDNFRRLKIG